MHCPQRREALKSTNCVHRCFALGYCLNQARYVVLLVVLVQPAMTLHLLGRSLEDMEQRCPPFPLRFVVF